MRRSRKTVFTGALLAVLLVIGSAAAERTYTVQYGDVLGSVAARFGVSTSALVAANPGLDPDRIRIGQTLRIPDGSAGSSQAPSGSSGGSSASSSYVVSSGDTMMGIADRLNVSYAAFRAANPGVEPDRIRIGQRLNVPSATGGGTTTAGTTSGGTTGYVVQSGDTLSAIASRMGVSIEELTSWNRGLDPDRIRIGQRLTIRTRRPTRQITHVVASGEFLSRIAERYDVTISELRSWNRGLDPDRIRIGQEIRIIQEGPERRSESYGSAFAGRLVNGEQLPAHPAYRIRRSLAAWGTNETITYILSGFDHVRRVYPNIPRLWIHDLSTQAGGAFPPHRSHQSGRDADIGYYHNRCTRTECQYGAVSASELNPQYNWALFEYWIDNGLVDYLFVDYTLQEKMVNYLRGINYSEARIAQVFQYPRGRHSPHGIIRHEPGHRTHFHVRFSCGANDGRCQ